MRRSLIVIALLPPKPLTVQGHLDQYRQFPGHESHLRTLALFVSPPVVLNVHRKSTPFPNPGLPRSILTSCAVSMGLGQHALTEVLIVPRWLPWPLVQGVFDCCFRFFEDLFHPDTVKVLLQLFMDPIRITTSLLKSFWTTKIWFFFKHRLSEETVVSLVQSQSTSHCSTSNP